MFHNHTNRDSRCSWTGRVMTGLIWWYFKMDIWELANLSLPCMDNALSDIKIAAITSSYVWFCSDQVLNTNTQSALSTAMLMLVCVFCLGALEPICGALNRGSTAEVPAGWITVIMKHESRVFINQHFCSIHSIHHQIEIHDILVLSDNHTEQILCSPVSNYLHKNNLHWTKHFLQ